MPCSRLLTSLVLGVCISSGYAQAPQPRAYALTGEYRGTHDPSIAKDGDTYYVFATGAALPPRPAGGARAAGEPRPQFAVRCSKDLKQWTRCGQVFPDVPAWIRALSPKTEDLWAPDVSYYDGLYHLYYSFSVFGKNTSGIALATNVTLDPASPRWKWVDRGLVLQSKETDDFNAIDPNLVIDGKGQTWLSFGSFWSGLKMRRVDRATGLLSKEDTRTYSLATRAKPAGGDPAKPGLPPDWQAIEAPFILPHEGFYYLFASWDLCCRGVKSTYHTVVGRAKDVVGPYADRSGKPMMDGGGTPLLDATDIWLGPGGESLLHRPEGDIIVFHAYDAKSGWPALQVSPIVWKDGWPTAGVEGASAPPR